MNTTAIKKPSAKRPRKKKVKHPPPLQWENRGPTAALASCPQEILDNILNRLNHPVEYIRLGKTCKALNQSVSNSSTWHRFTVHFSKNVKPNPRSKKTGTWKQIVSRNWKYVCDGCFGVSVKSNLNHCRIMAADTAGKTCWTCFVKEWREYHNSLPEFAKEPILRQTRMKRVKWEVVEILKWDAMKLYGLKRRQMSVLKCRMTTSNNWSHRYGDSPFYHLHAVRMLGAFVKPRMNAQKRDALEDALRCLANCIGERNHHYASKSCMYGLCLPFPPIASEIKHIASSKFIGLSFVKQHQMFVKAIDAEIKNAHGIQIKIELP
ncbi:hypothetical protein BC829DRAFT_453786 [Chytridium lagenaria]|nr:hypothetical protein BC829DRAFT_453786 [Chytridium lagenaria]